MKKIIFVLGLMVAATACYKDKGNYDYQTINDLAISMADTITAIKGETLKVVPEINSAAGSGNDNRLQYQWTVRVGPGVINNSTDSAILLLSSQRNLSAVVNLYAQPTPYAMQLKVTDTVTGVTYTKFAQLKVTSNYNAGWMLLEQGTTSSDIAFVNPGQQKAYYNLFSTANTGTTLPATAHHVYSFSIPKTQGAGFAQPASVINMVLYENGGFLLEDGTFKKTGDYSTLFGTTPAIIKPQSMYLINNTDILTVNNGKLHRRYYSKGELYFGDAYQSPDALGYTLAPYMESSFSTGLLFDQANHRFLTEKFNAYGFYTFYSNPGAAFDATNIQQTMLGIGKGQYNAYQYGIFKNTADDACTIYTFIGNGVNKMQEVDEAAGMAKSPGYAFPTSRNQLYYAADSKIYLFDITANTYTEIFDFGTGENITSIGLENNMKLVVATHNGTQGKVYGFPLQLTGEVDGATYTESYSGFKKIVAMTYVK